MSDESDKWAAQQPVADPAVDFAMTFLGCRMGNASDQPLDAAAVARLKTIARAVSWSKVAMEPAAAWRQARIPSNAATPATVGGRS